MRQDCLALSWKGFWGMKSLTGKKMNVQNVDPQDEDNGKQSEVSKVLKLENNATDKSEFPKIKQFIQLNNNSNNKKQPNQKSEWKF